MSAYERYQEARSRHVRRQARSASLVPLQVQRAPTLIFVLTCPTWLPTKMPTSCPQIYNGQNAKTCAEGARTHPTQPNEALSEFLARAPQGWGQPCTSPGPLLLALPKRGACLFSCAGGRFVRARARPLFDWASQSHS